MYSKGRRFNSRFDYRLVYSKGRRFDSHRGQAYFLSLPGVDIHSE